MIAYMQINPQRFSQDLQFCVAEVIFDMRETDERRVLRAKLLLRYLPEGYDMKTYVPTGGDQGLNMLVWDIDARGWRAFPIDRVVSCQMLPGYN